MFGWTSTNHDRQDSTLIWHLILCFFYKNRALFLFQTNTGHEIRFKEMADRRSGQQNRTAVLPLLVSIFLSNLKTRNSIFKKNHSVLLYPTNPLSCYLYLHDLCYIDRNYSHGWRR